MATAVQVNEAAIPITEPAFVEEALRMFAADPVNRDIALARCLFYLQRLNRAADALESALPALSAMASGPMGKLLGVGK